jgi:hypothetical protein
MVPGVCCHLISLIHSVVNQELVLRHSNNCYTLEILHLVIIIKTYDEVCYVGSWAKAQKHAMSADL